MNFDAFQFTFAHRLGWALIHFVWQGALVALLLKLTLGVFQRRSPNVRYAIACGAMLCLVVAPVVTFFALPPTPAQAEAVIPSAAQGAPTAKEAANEAGTPSVIVRVLMVERTPVRSTMQWLDAQLPVLLSTWFTGVLLLSVRLGVGWWQVHRLATAGSPLTGTEWSSLLARVSGRVGVARPVRLLQSTLVTVPTALGWLRPAVLLPASTLTGLRPDELEWILAHELAHIRRRDYLVNLLQSAAETLLFYHPAVWWVSARMRVERELCCDDMVIATGGDPVGYAGALATLENLRGSTGLAVAASGGPLLRRVRRLLGYPSTDSASGVWVLGAAAVLACVLWCAGQRQTFGTQVTSEQPKFTEVPKSSATIKPIPAEEFIVDPFTGAPVERDRELPPLFTRTYKVEPNSFLASIRKLLSKSNENPPEAPDTPALLHAFMAHAGWEFSTNSVGVGVQGLPQASGKALFFNDRSGLLLVRATLDEQDKVERALAELQSAPPQVLIEIKFVELSDSEFQSLDLDSLLTQDGQEDGVLVTNRTGILIPPTGTNDLNLSARYALRGVEQVTRGVRGILTDAQFKTAIRTFERIPGVNLLAAPKITTLSGRQARIEVAEVRDIITGVDRASTAGEPNVFTTTAVPVGASIDVIPNVLADGKTIQITLIPGIATFVGYDNPEQSEGLGADGLVVQQPLPRFSVTQTITTVKVPDGNTLVMTGFGRVDEAEVARRAPPKQILIFVTPTVIDSTGKRVNAD